MTKYSILNTNDEYIIEVKGHANFSDTNDIVCSSISTAIYMTRNTIVTHLKQSQFSF